MRENALYCIGSDGQIEKRCEVSANDDIAALDQARQLGHEYEIEIWQGEHIVSRVAKDGTASWKLSPVSRRILA